MSDITWTDPFTGIEWYSEEVPGLVTMVAFNQIEGYVEDVNEYTGETFQAANGMSIITLFDYTKYDSAFRADCPFDDSCLYWCIDTYAGSDQVAWTADAKDGKVYPSTKDNKRKVLLIK